MGNDTEQFKKSARVPVILNTIMLVMITASFWLLAWTARTVVAHGEMLAMHSTEFRGVTSRLEGIELVGSRALDTHIEVARTEMKILSERIQRVEDAITTLKAIDARLQELRSGQDRIEGALSEHMKEKQP